MIPLGVLDHLQLFGVQTATIPASRIHPVGFTAVSSPRAPLRSSACLEAIDQPINPEWKSSNGADVVKGIRSSCRRFGQAGLRSP